MFAKLSGVLDDISDEGIVIDVQGVGYLVSVSRSCLDRLGPMGSAVKLLIDTHVREDKIALYGFADRDERAWFRQLITVQGVGAKVALAVLSVLPPNALALAITSGDSKAVTRADGVGPKLAARITSELKGKTPLLMTSADSLALPPSVAVPAAAVPADQALMADAVSALVNLGYGRSEAFSAVLTAKSAQGAEATTSSLIRAGLKELAPA